MPTKVAIRTALTLTLSDKKTISASSGFAVSTKSTAVENEEEKVDIYVFFYILK
jgi:hypothetical protein